jgi:hypothetical protein
VSVGNFIITKDTVPRLESVLLFSEGDDGASEKGIAGFRKCVRLNVSPSLTSTVVFVGPIWHSGATVIFEN